MLQKGGLIGLLVTMLWQIWMEHILRQCSKINAIHMDIVPMTQHQMLAICIVQKGNIGTVIVPRCSTHKSDLIRDSLLFSPFLNIWPNAQSQQGFFTYAIAVLNSGPCGESNSSLNFKLLLETLYMNVTYVSCVFYPSLDVLVQIVA